MNSPITAPWPRSISSTMLVTVTSVSISCLTSNSLSVKGATVTLEATVRPTVLESIGVLVQGGGDSLYIQLQSQIQSVYSKTPLFQSPLNSNSHFVRIYCPFLYGFK